MNKIYKYELKTVDSQAIKVPASATFLSLQVQKGTLCIWVMVDSNETEMKTLHIRIFGTGHSISDELHGRLSNFLGTYQLSDGDLVFHTFVEEIDGEV